MEAYCERALALGVQVLCFTDHLDHNPRDEGYGYYGAEAYFAAFAQAQARYGGRLTLLRGLEFSEPHCYPQELEQARKRPYDFILGSIHYWVNDLFASEVLPSGISNEESWAVYWQEVQAAVRHGGFDALAHPDFPKRYGGASLWETAQLREIFQIMGKNKIALEINTSSLRKGYSEAMPGSELLQLYRDTGGRLVTLGTDAHKPEDLFTDIPAQKERCEALGLEEVFYQNHRARPTSWAELP